MEESLVLFEDEHLLVVHKPAGINTHRAAPGAQDGLYDFLRDRDPGLAIQHRLDRETSGVLLFTRTGLAHKSLARQFEEHQIEKVYHFLTAANPPAGSLTVKLPIGKVGNRYQVVKNGAPAETRFRLLSRSHDISLMEARPVTGRTHQIRIHAAASRFAVMGDREHGADGGWPRLYLHAVRLSFRHPVTDATVMVEAPYSDSFRRAWEGERDCVRLALSLAADRRRAVIDARTTDAYRLVHGAGDALAGLYVDRLGSTLLAASADDIPQSTIDQLAGIDGVSSIYTKKLRRDVRKVTGESAAPVLVAGDPAPSRFRVRESGVVYELSLIEGYSPGIFLDQRENRRRILEGSWGSTRARRTVLNTFAYTAAFSVCAARAGDQVTTIDLSRRYLDWGRDNFRANGLDPGSHDWIFGDVFDWLKRLKKQGRRFDLVILDPPTFSTAKGSGMFRAARDYGRLADLALALVAPGGTLLACTNAAGLEPAAFLATLRGAAAAVGRAVAHDTPATQPLDFPVVAAEPAYLKVWWARFDR